jgi:uncharacterized membrane protein
MDFLNLLKPYGGRILWSGAGLLTALLFLSIGFLKTLVILICFALGYVIGLQADGKIDLKPKIKSIFNWLKK